MPTSHLILWCPQSFPASGTFPMSWLFVLGDQNTGASAVPSVLPMSIQGRLTSLFSLLSKGLSGVFSSTRVQRHQFFGALPCLRSSSHNHSWPLGRPQPWLYRPFVVSRVTSLLFNTLSRFVTAFLPRSNRLLISWQVTICSDFRAQEEEICHYFHLFPFYLPRSNGAECHDLSFFNI